MKDNFNRPCLLSGRNLQLVSPRGMNVRDKTPVTRAAAISYPRQKDEVLESMLNVGDKGINMNDGPVLPSPKVKERRLIKTVLEVVELSKKKNVGCNRSLVKNIYKGAQDAPRIGGEVPWVPTAVVENKLHKRVHREAKTCLKGFYRNANIA